MQCNAILCNVIGFSGGNGLVLPHGDIEMETNRHKEPIGKGALHKKNRVSFIDEGCILTNLIREL